MAEATASASAVSRFRNPLAVSASVSYSSQLVGTHLFPASIPAIAFTVPSGLRNNTSGDLWGVGTNGYAWSSSPTSGSTNAGYLDSTRRT